jgi:EmrB/QacA subfamily drug resistance transporter
LDFKPLLEHNNNFRLYTMMTPTEQLSQNHSSQQKAGWILFAVCILGIMLQIDFTAVNVALPAISHAIDADLNTVQWALSAYVLAWGALVVTAGRCADLFGKRRTFLLGVIFFMLGSGLSGAATQAWFLIFGRVVQGIGGALFLPGLYTLVFTAFPENKRGFAMGVLTSAISIGLAIGPTFGGVVLHLLNWRWIFFLNIPLGIPILAIILWAVEKEPWRLSAETLDYWGAILLALSLVILMYAVNQVNLWGASSAAFLFCVGTSILLLIIFLWFERRQTHPLIQLEMFSNPVYLGCSLAYVIIAFTFSTVLIVSGLYLENALNYSALNAGFIFLVMTAMFAIVSIYGGKLADRSNPQIPVVLSGVAMAAAFFTFALCTQHSPLWVPMLALALYGAGCGLGFPALNTTMMKSVPTTLLSTASSAFAMFGCIGNTIGLILSSLVITIFAQRRLEFLIQPQHFNSEQIAQLHAIAKGAHYTAAQFASFPAANIPTLLDTLHSAFIHGMFINMIITMGLTLLMVIIGVTLIKKT